MAFTYDEMGRPHELTMKCFQSFSRKESLQLLMFHFKHLWKVCDL